MGSRPRRASSSVQLVARWVQLARAHLAYVEESRCDPGQIPLGRFFTKELGGEYHLSTSRIVRGMSVLPNELDLGEAIRTVVTEHARVVSADRLSEDDDLYRAGMTSHATVNVMLALEDALGLEFPDKMLTRSTFQTMSSIRRAVESLSQTTS